MNSFVLDEKSEKIIETTLNIGSLDEIIDRDYKDHAPANNAERQVAESFGSFNRGSVRYVIRSFYTTEEIRKAEIDSNNFFLP
jgi:hypothetical protein